MSTLNEEVEQYLRRRIAEGFDDDETIAEDAGEYLADEYPEKDLANAVAELLPRLSTERVAEERTWKEPTDCDRLDLAFEKLEKSGIVARQNFACCQNCGHAEIGDEIEAARSSRAVRGYVFYHMQDTENAAEQGGLYLAYGSESGEDEQAVAVGHEIKAALEGVGLTIRWDGELSSRIYIADLDWKRRRSTSSPG